MLKKASMGFLMAQLFLPAWNGLSAAAPGDPIRLFESRGVPVSDYEARLAALRPGDVVEFSDGVQIPVRRILNTEGLGYSTFFFATDHNQLVRMPRRKGIKIQIDHGVNVTYRRLHEDYLRFAPILKEAGVSIPKIDFERSLPGERIFVEELVIYGTLADFVKNQRHLHPLIRERFVQDAHEFLASTWKIEKLADFTLDQVALTPHGAVLLDWGFSITLASSLSSGMVFRHSRNYLAMRGLQIGDRQVELFSGVPDISGLDPKNPYFKEALVLEIQGRRRAAGMPSAMPWERSICWSLFQR